jgi:hypothetical protein
MFLSVFFDWRIETMLMVCIIIERYLVIPILGLAVTFFLGLKGIVSCPPHF